MLVFRMRERWNNSDATRGKCVDSSEINVWKNPGVVGECNGLTASKDFWESVWLPGEGMPTRPTPSTGLACVWSPPSPTTLWELTKEATLISTLARRHFRLGSVFRIQDLKHSLNIPPPDVVWPDVVLGTVVSATFLHRSQHYYDKIYYECL